MALPNAFSNNGSGTPAWAQNLVKLNPNGSVGQTNNSGMISNANGTPASTFSQNITNKAVTSPGVLPKNTGTTYSGMLNNTSSNNPSPANPPAKTEQELREEQKKVISDQITGLQKQVKTQQEGIANGTIDAQGNKIQRTTTPPPYQPPKTDAYNTNIETLTNIAKNGTPEVQSAMDTLKKAQDKYNIDILNNIGKAQTAGDLTGSENVLNVTDQRAITNALAIVNAYQTSQGQQIGAAGTAGGLSQPVGQFGMLTNPQTGEPLNTKVFQSAISQAQQLVNSGVPANDQSVTALLSPFGFVGPLAFNQAMQSQSGGNWNPAAQSAGASQTLEQGTQAQGQAFTLDTGIKQLTTLTPIIQSIMKSSGINSTDSPLYNKQIGTYISQLGNPGAWSQFQYTMGEMRKFQSQLLASGAGGIPTDVSNTINSTDISQLSVKDINTALETLDILGKNQQAILQGQQQATGVTGYSGSPQSVQTNVPTATPSTSPGSGVTTPGGQFAAGTGLSTLDWAKEQLANLSSEVLSFIAGGALKK